MDIKEKISEILSKVKNDKDFAKKFTSDPVKAVESIIGIDLPDDQINTIVDGVKAKLDVEKVGGIFNSVKKMFGK